MSENIKNSTILRGPRYDLNVSENIKKWEKSLNHNSIFLVMKKHQIKA